jgi:endonuclease/exonuclease/phosphatase (EEP) superfamily protein YafD
MLKFMLAKFANILFFSGCLGCIFVVFLPWWPEFYWAIIPKYLLLFGPRWWLLFLVFLIAIFGLFLAKWQKLSWFFLLLIALNYLDFQIPQLAEKTNHVAQQQKIKVITYNIGGVSKQELLRLVKYLRPDILLLQEAASVNLMLFATEYPFSECISGLCIISKYAFKQTAQLPRKIVGGWGSFAVFYRLAVFETKINLANVHLETPRPVLMGVLHREFNVRKAQQVESGRKLEADLISLWSKQHNNVIIAGDFNMPADENIYRRAFSHLTNAVDTHGVGFYSTKYTSWYSTRIDHILYSDPFAITQVDVVKMKQGDHRPLMAIISLEN